MNRKALALKILDSLRSTKPDYADVRVVRRQSQDIELKKSKVSRLEENSTCGFGLRVLVDGFWGFSSHHYINDDSISRTIQQAIQMAELARRGAKSLPGARVEFPKRAGKKASWKSPCQIDPFSVSLGDKLSVMSDWCERLGRVKGVSLSVAVMSFIREDKIFASTEGSEIEQTIIRSGMGYSATATDAQDAQIRSFPNSMGGQFLERGYEMIEDFDFGGEAERVGNQSVELLSAPQCPQGKFDIILDSSQLALQIHESCGHPAELDRILGWEANYAGRSFMEPGHLGSFKYGSSIVNITADSVTPGGVGTYGFDDEGSEATRWKLVNDGFLSISGMPWLNLKFLTLPTISPSLIRRVPPRVIPLIISFFSCTGVVYQAHVTKIPFFVFLIRSCKLPVPHSSSMYQLEGKAP